MPAEPTPRTVQRATRVAAIALGALALLLLVAPAGTAATATFKATSADGGIAFFETEERLVPGDTDTKRDVYQRSFDPMVGEGGAYVTRVLSTGPTGGNDAYNALFEKASADGKKIFFSTDERLVAADTDRRSDVYLRERETGTTTLVSTGAAACAPACGNDEVDAGFAAAGVDGAVVFFVSEERLSAGDADDSLDVFVRDLIAGTTSRVSAGGASCTPACGNGAADAFLRGISADATTAYFTSAESLSSADLDTVIDIYARDLTGASTTLVSQAGACAPICGNGSAVPVYRGSSNDGDRAFFTTDEALVQSDEDGATDVYARDLPGGPTTLISGGSPTALTASFNGASADGAVAFFTTTEDLAGGDTNGAADVYRWSGGSPALVTSGTCTQESGCGSNFNAATADAGIVVFTTTEQLAAADEDASADVYVKQIGGGSPELASHGDASCAPICGNGTAAAIFNAISGDASKLLFSTSEALATGDADADADIYRHEAGDPDTAFLSPPGFCPIPVKQGGCDVVFGGASSDTGHVFFQTSERLGLDDGDSEADVYERAFDPDAGEEVTRLVSVGNSADLELGPSTPVLEDTDPPSPSATVTPSILGESDPNTSIKIYIQAGCSGEVKATGTTADLGGTGIQVGVASNSTTTFWATATDVNGDTSDCSNSLAYTHESGSGEGEGEGEGGGGSSGGGGFSKGGKNVKIEEATIPTGPVYTTPHTRITFAPAAKTRSRNPVFRFLDATGQDGTRFRCKIDSRKWRSCGSPVKVRKLGRGRHVFAVKGINALGVAEPKPAKRSFKVAPG
jgi:hypothetical protein